MARQLRTHGRKDEAAVVAKLRKPPVTAWAVNQLARAQPALITAVVEAGHSLRSAMEQAMAGDRSALADAQAAERRALQDGADGAADVLAASGHAPSDSARRRMIDTLRAASTDPTVVQLLRAGVLGNDVDSTGLGFNELPGAGTGAAPASSAPASSAPASTSPAASTQSVADSPPAEPAAGPPATSGTDNEHPPASPRRSAADSKAEAARKAEEKERQKTLERRRKDLESEVDLRRRRANRLAGQLEAAEAELVELRQSAAAAAQALAEGQAELDTLGS